MWQIVVNSLIGASVYGLIAVGFVLIYRTANFFHFAHAASFTAGPYFVYLFKNNLDFPLVLSVVLAIGCSAVLGILMEIIVFRYLRRRESPSIVFLLASLSMYIVLQNIISLIFGDSQLSIRNGVLHISEGIDVFDAYVTSIQAITISTYFILFIAISIFLAKTKIGIAMRSVANDSAFANISGIDSEKIILWTFGASSAFAGVAGILVGMDIDITPNMGMSPMLMVVVVVIIGGAGNIIGSAIGALLLATVQQFGAWKFGSEWQDSIAFVLLLLFLLIRPQGVVARKTIM